MARLIFVVVFLLGNTAFATPTLTADATTFEITWSFIQIMSAAVFIVIVYSLMMIARNRRRLIARRKLKNNG